MVKAKLLRPLLNSKMVNRSAPDLFPVMFILKKSFIWRKTKERCAFDRIGMSEPLKAIVLL
jgi:hypothetical protein